MEKDKSLGERIVIIRNMEEELGEFYIQRRKSLIEGAIATFANSVALTGHYNVDMDVHPFPAHDFIFFEFKLTHKDEEYSLHSSSASGRGFYFEPNLN